MKQREGTERRGGWIGAAAALALMIFGLTGIIRWIAGDAEGMGRAMLRFAPLEKTGLPAEEYAGVAEMMTGYLTGREPAFQYIWTGPNGESYLGFHDYEAAHMADCRALIRLDTVICCACFVIAAALIALTAFQARKCGRNRWACFWTGGQTGFWVLNGILAMLVLWACADFDSLFLLFHQTAFRNDLWLLNPRTDLLIRLMPEALFVDLGMKGLRLAAGWIAVIGIGLWLGIRSTERGGKHGIQGNRGEESKGAAGKRERPDSGAGNQL